MNSVKEIVLHALEIQDNKGLETYGVTLDDCNYDNYDMQAEAIFELIDAVKYIARENLELRRKLAQKDCSLLDCKRQ